MAQKNPQNSKGLATYVDRRLPLINNVKWEGLLLTPAPMQPPQAAALLLTTAPMETLSHEIIRISALAPHFSALNIGIRYRLSPDPYADRLRTTLMKFNLYMDAAAEQLCIAFANARGFYAHNREEIIPRQDGYGQLTEEMVATLLQPKFQEDTVKRARGVAEQVANAANIVRRILPLVPQIKMELEEYVAGYLDRVSTRERRKGSWIRSFFDDIFGDPIAPTPWKPEEVSALPQHLSEGVSLLNLLPAFLDNMELHFRRLSEIQSEQVFDLGYTTTEDLTRLYLPVSISSITWVANGRRLFWHSHLLRRRHYDDK